MKRTWWYEYRSGLGLVSTTDDRNFLASFIPPMPARVAGIGVETREANSLRDALAECDDMGGDTSKSEDWKPPVDR